MPLFDRSVYRLCTNVEDISGPSYQSGVWVAPKRPGWVMTTVTVVKCADPKIQITNTSDDTSFQMHSHGEREYGCIPHGIDSDSWGFARVPSMQELSLVAKEILQHKPLGSCKEEDVAHQNTEELVRVASEHGEAEASLEAPVPLLHRAFLDALLRCPALRSTHCEGEQAKALGSQVYDNRFHASHSPVVSLFLLVVHHDSSDLTTPFPP